MNYNKNLRISLLLLFLLVTSACGGGRNPDLELKKEAEESSEKISGRSFKTLSAPEDITVSEKEVSGSGAILFLDALTEVESSNHFSLSFRLEIGGNLNLIVNSDQLLETGIELFIHAPAIESPLVAYLIAQGKQIDLTTYFLESQVFSKAIISLDVHNNEGEYAHIVIWDDTNGILKAEPIYDSGSVRGGSPGRGFGANWGLSFLKARIFDVQKDKPRDEH